MASSAGQNKAVNTPVATDEEWETVIEESPQAVIFEEVGDVFEGYFCGVEHVEPEDQAVDKDHKDYVSFDRWLFRDKDNTLVGVSESFKLDQRMLTIPQGTWTRITLTKKIPSKRGNDLLDFKVQTRKS